MASPFRNCMIMNKLLLLALLTYKRRIIMVLIERTDVRTLIKCLAWCLSYFYYCINHWQVHRFTGKEEHPGSKETQTQESSHLTSQYRGAGSSDDGRMEQQAQGPARSQASAPPLPSSPC